MKPYEELTPAGKKRRLRILALLALEHYEIQITSLEYYMEQTNIFFSLTDNNGKKYALKIFREETTTLQDNLAEIFLLDEVKKNSELTIPNVIKTRDNQSIVVISSPFFDTPKRVAIYSWLDGVLFVNNETPERFYNLGAAVAKLHIATEHTAIPSDMNLRRWDNIFYFNGGKTVYKEKQYKHIIDDNFLKVMDFIVPYLNSRLEQYYRNSNLQIIHGDLNPWNVLINDEEIRFIDFEDNIIGLPFHDFGVMLFYYKYSNRLNYSEICEHFYKGYSSVKHLPAFTEYDIDLLITARFVNFFNIVLMLNRNAQEFCLTRIKRVEEFIAKYAEEEYEKYLKSL